MEGVDCPSVKHLLLGGRHLRSFQQPQVGVLPNQIFQQQPLLCQLGSQVGKTGEEGLFVFQDFRPEQLHKLPQDIGHGPRLFCRTKGSAAEGAVLRLYFCGGGQAPLGATGGTFHGFPVSFPVDNHKNYTPSPNFCQQSSPADGNFPPGGEKPVRRR